MSGNGIDDWGASSGGTPPPTQLPFRLEPLSYGGPASITGDPATVALIHRTDRTFDLFETMTLSALASITTVTSGMIAIYAPDAMLYMAIPGWVLAFGLSGFAAFRIKLSKSGLDMTGQSAAPAATTQGRAKK